MKRIITLICCAALVFTASLTSIAVDFPQNRIYAETVNAKAGEEIQIPVKISNNTGFMGFAIDIEYSRDVLTPISVEQSELLIGMLNDSIETSESNEFRVLYTGSEAVATDGVLFTVMFSAAETASGTVTVKMSYSQEDTFDENVQDVVFNCENILISFEDEPEPSEDLAKISARLADWANSLKSPWNKMISLLLKPVIWLLTLLGR